MKYTIDFKREKIINTFGFLIIIFYSINIFGYGVYIPFLLIIPMALHLVKGKFSRFYVINLFMLGIFSVLFVLVLNFNSNVSFGNKLMFLFFPLTLFLLGHKFVEKEIDLKKFIKFIYLIIISFTLFALLSFLNTIYVYADYETAVKLLKGRYVLSVWDNSMITATGLNTYLSLSVSLLGLVFINSSGLKNTVLIKVLSLFLFFIGIFISFNIGNRTSIVIMIVSFVFIVLFSEKISSNKIASLCSILLVAMLTKVAFENNWFNLKQIWESSDLYVRFFGTKLAEDPRINAWKDSLEGIIRNPVNTQKIDLDLNFAHNMWLDVGVVSGLFPFVLLTLFSLFCLCSLFTFLKSNHPIIIKGLLIGIFTSFYLQFFVEPIFQGWFTYFNIFCFIIGMLIKINHNIKVSRNTEYNN